MHRIKLIFSLLTILLCYSRQCLHAQCSISVNTFPYDQDFETGPNNWTPSSSAHWEWGTPVAKTQITTAGSGSFCWIAGGLSGSNYNSGNSELISPCFDLSSLAYPEISFKSFWETELSYDGVMLQYTTDGGVTWNTLGTANSDDPCLGIENWFNYSPVNFLNGNPGWSGNVQNGGPPCLYGQGSGQWKTSRHNLSNLRGQTNVIFKFVFGAGTICNGFDGFGLDDVHIGEVPPNTGADFNYTCSANNTAQFTNNHLNCQQSWSWNFGDPASGTANTSTEENPQHVFSGPGTYSVSLTVNYENGPPAVVPPKTIRIANAVPAVTEIKCHDDQNGAISVTVNPASSYSYHWDTNPPQLTSSINNLGPGTYTVTITGTNTCSIAVPVTLINPDPLTANPVAQPAKCGNNNGSITANASGGTQPYTYTWSVSQSGATITSLAPGTYDLSYTDANNCPSTPVTGIVVPAVTNNFNITLGNNTTICPGQSLVLNPGSFAAYAWQDGSTNPTFTVTSTGTYSVTVTDQDGCTASAHVDIIVDCKGIYFPSAFTPNTDAINPTFGALGDIGSLTKYTLSVYNRYGQLIFNSTNPFVKWDGTFKGAPQGSGAYPWMVTYVQGNKGAVFQKGTVMIIR